MHVADKVIVVTGAGSGMGREVALELLRRGARVAGGRHKRGRLDETVVWPRAAPKESPRKP